ncbi:MAG: hypothetical protein JWR11_590 [Mycobacterium sp.]|nr:hypothetical protein [Mycobacterium sp.]MDT5176665.1 hypothetical protein [Mycobacterium sp.]
MTIAPLLTSILDWLRAGYPEGVPGPDRVPLLTHHDAGPENVRRVAARLAAAGWPLSGLDVAGADDEAAQALGKDPE